MVVAVAREFPDVPVKTIWSREQCFQQGRYRTPHHHTIQGGARRRRLSARAVTSRASFVGTRPLYRLTLGYDDMPYFTSGIIPHVDLSSTNLPRPRLEWRLSGTVLQFTCFFRRILRRRMRRWQPGSTRSSIAYGLVSRWDKTLVRLPASRRSREGGLGAGHCPKVKGRGIAITAWPQGAMARCPAPSCAPRLASRSAARASSPSRKSTWPSSAAASRIAVPCARR